MICRALEDLYNVIRDNISKIPNTKLVNNVLRPISYKEIISIELEKFKKEYKEDISFDKWSVWLEDRLPFQKWNRDIACEIMDFLKNEELYEIFYCIGYICERGLFQDIENDLDMYVPLSLQWVFDSYGSDRVDFLVNFLAPWLCDGIMKEELDEIRIMYKILLNKK